MTESSSGKDSCKILIVGLFFGLLFGGLGGTVVGVWLSMHYAPKPSCPSCTVAPAWFEIQLTGVKVVNNTVYAWVNHTLSWGNVGSKYEYSEAYETALHKVVIRWATESFDHWQFTVIVKFIPDPNMSPDVSVQTGPISLMGAPVVQLSGNTLFAYFGFTTSQDCGVSEQVASSVNNTPLGQSGE